MINRFSILSILAMFLLAALPKPVLADISLGIATDTHTHPSTTELKPASFIDLSKSYKVASVCFLGVGDCDPNTGFGTGDDYGVDSEEQCLSAGYTKNSCGSLEEPLNICPYNPAYSKGCKCKSSLISCPSGQAGVGASCDGKYVSCGCDSNLKTCASNQVGSGAFCGGKYESCSCKSEYQFTSSNCSYPRSVSGSSCGGKYTNCSCPAGVSTGSYGCQEYYPAPCNSVCKIAKGDNCDKRTEVQTPYGCMSYFADCPSKCERAYTDNCRNRTAVTCQFGCTSYFADCQTKCQSCTSDNCANRSAATCEYGCSAYFSDCSSKCQTCKGNPDCDVTALTCNNGCKTSNSCGKCTECNTEKPSLTVHWSAPSPFKLVMFYAMKNCPPSYTTHSCPSGIKITIGSLTGSHGTIEYSDLEIGDTLNLTDGYGIVEGTTTGSDKQDLETPTYITFSEGKNYTVNVRFAGTVVEEPTVPLAYVKEVYNIYGSSRQSEFFPILAEQRNTKLYTSYSNPEHYGVTSNGADYSLRGTNSSTSLTLYYNPKPYAGLSGGNGGVAYCTTSSITKNGSTIPLNNNGDSYVQVTRYVNEPEMTVIITYNCNVI